MSSLPTRTIPVARPRTRANNGEKHFIQISERPEEVDELVDEWTPELLGAPLTPEEQNDLASVPVVSGANGPKPKLANTGKQVLKSCQLQFHRPRWQRDYQSARDRDTPEIWCR